MKKLVCTLLIAILVVIALSPVVLAASSSGVELTDSVGNPLKYPTVTAGNTLSYQFCFSYPDTLTDSTISVDIKTSTDLAVFPFDPVFSSYEQVLQRVAISGNRVVYIYEFNMRCRGDASQKFYEIPFQVTTSLGTEEVVANVSVTSGGGGSGTVTNVPKVIITGFTTSPQDVVAGEEFTLNITFKNTSGSTSATNIKAQLSSADGTFTPISGSTTLFIDSLAPNATATKSIKLKAKADAAPGSYSVTFALNFDVANIEEPIADSEVLSIPVIQLPRVNVSKMQVTPSEVYVGRDINVMASVNNTGKSKLYNVSVKFSDPNGVFDEAEQFLGTIEPGATGAIDVYISALMEGDGNIVMTVTYEDENGTVYDPYEETYNTYVMQQGGIVDPFPTPEPEPDSNSSLWWLLLIPVVAAAVVAFILLRKRKKNRETLEDDREKIAELEALYSQQPGDSSAVETAPMAGDESATIEMDPVTENSEKETEGTTV